MNPYSTTLIGDPTRDKWIAFLTRAFEDGYITLSEFQERADAVLAARTLRDIYQNLADFSSADREAWNKSWTERRTLGNATSAVITPPPPQSPEPRHKKLLSSTYAVMALTTAAVVGLIELIVILLLVLA